MLLFSFCYLDCTESCEILLLMQYFCAITHVLLFVIVFCYSYVLEMLLSLFMPCHISVKKGKSKCTVITVINH